MPSNSPTTDSSSGDIPGRLYVVATPIGNRGDITLRALDTLAEVDLIAAEDTRHTGRFLSFYNIKTPLISYHNYNEKERTRSLLIKLQQGLSIALVSNAGTPSVSDPGYSLVKAAIEGGISVVPIPGPSAIVSALSVAGLPTDSFVFVGFPVRKKEKHLRELKKLAGENKTLIFYESSRRIVTLLQELISTLGDRYGVLSREMTKIHEEFIRGLLSDILYHLNKRVAVKGECTLLVSGCKETKESLLPAVQKELRTAMENSEVKLSDIVKTIAAKYGIYKNVVYAEALNIKKNVRNDLSKKD